MAKLTLFWMDLIRNRLKTYPYRNLHDKKIIKDFIAPIISVGAEAELDIKKSLIEDKKKIIAQFEHDGEIIKEMIKQFKVKL